MTENKNSQLEKENNYVIFFYGDNHTFVHYGVFEVFENFYSKITTVLNEKGEPYFIDDVAADIHSIVHDIVYDSLTITDEDEDRYIAIPINILIQHIEECVEDEVKTKLCLKTEKDISKYPDFTKCNVVFHKGRYYSKVGNFDKYHFTLANIINDAADEYDRDKKAKKAIKKRTIATFEMVTRDIYAASGKAMKVEKLCKRLEESKAKFEKAKADISKVEEEHPELKEPVEPVSEQETETTSEEVKAE